MTIVPFQPQQTFSNTRPSSMEIMDRGIELAEIIAGTDFVPKSLRNNQPAILAAILYGHEIGLEPMHSLSSISMIEGKPTLSAEAQRALILAAGHEFWIEDATNTHATAVGRRADSKQTHRVTWTLDDAKRARIAGRANWQAYPRAMLVARASAELARQVFADIIGGYPATEEMDGFVELVDGQPAAPEGPPPPATRKRRRPTSSTAGTAFDPPLPEPDPPAEPPAPEPSPGPPPEGPKPEAEPAEPEPAEPDPPSDAAIGMMFALYKQKGLTEREERLAHAEDVLERSIGSSNELSALDMSRIIDALNEMPDVSPFAPPPGALEPLPEAEQAVITDLESELDARPPLPDDEA